jgi:hypothetical protein
MSSKTIQIELESEEGISAELLHELAQTFANIIPYIAKDHISGTITAKVSISAPDQDGSIDVTQPDWANDDSVDPNIKDVFGATKDCNCPVCTLVRKRARMSIMRSVSQNSRWN